jgi:hypothetical protein
MKKYICLILFLGLTFLFCGCRYLSVGESGKDEETEEETLEVISEVTAAGVPFVGTDIPLDDIIEIGIASEKYTEISWFEEKEYEYESETEPVTLPPETTTVLETTEDTDQALRQDIPIFTVMTTEPETTATVTDISETTLTNQREEIEQSPAEESAEPTLSVAEEYIGEPISTENTINGEIGEPVSVIVSEEVS